MSAMGYPVYKQYSQFFNTALICQKLANKRSTFVLGMLLPCFFVLVPLLALMLYGMVAASLQLRA